VNAKARGLIGPVLGTQKTAALIKQINALEELNDVRRLRALITV
jgi:hypothetical protein